MVKPSQETAQRQEEEEECQWLWRVSESVLTVFHCRAPLEDDSESTLQRISLIDTKFTVFSVFCFTACERDLNQVELIRGVLHGEPHLSVTAFGITQYQAA